MIDLGELVVRASNGDVAALTVLLQLSRPHLVRSVAAKLPPMGNGWLDAEDIVQDSLVAAFKHITEFRAEGSQAFDRWLQTIVENRTNDALRAACRKKRGGHLCIRSFDHDTVVGLLEVIAAPLKTPGSQAVRTEAIRVLLSELDTLPEDQRRAVWLVHGKGMSIAVGAAEMGKTEPAFRGLCARGLKKLRAALRDSGTLTRGS